jgi:hypothetical protein
MAYAGLSVFNICSMQSLPSHGIIAIYTSEPSSHHDLAVTENNSGIIKAALSQSPHNILSASHSLNSNFHRFRTFMVFKSEHISNTQVIIVKSLACFSYSHWAAAHYRRRIRLGNHNRLGQPH